MKNVIIVSGPRYNHNAVQDDKKNLEILQCSLADYNGPKARVGQWLKLPNGKYTRFTYDWGEQIQTGGGPGPGFYLGDGYMSYSGGLNPGIEHQYLELTDETLPGGVWFFSRGWAGAACGVNYTIMLPVWKVKDGAPVEKLSGLWMENDDRELSGNYSIDRIIK